MSGTSQYRSKARLWDIVMLYLHKNINFMLILPMLQKHQINVRNDMLSHASMKLTCIDLLINFSCDICLCLFICEIKL